MIIYDNLFILQCSLKKLMIEDKKWVKEKQIFLQQNKEYIK